MFYRSPPHVNAANLFDCLLLNGFQQIIGTQPGSRLTVYYQSATGEKFELGVYDGNSRNATMLMSVTQWTGVNQAVMPSLSSGQELYIRFRFRADSKDARVKFLITENQGRKI